MSVADTGAGLDDAPAGSGIGLANIRERLALLYGERARSSSRRTSRADFVARIVLPRAAPCAASPSAPRRWLPSPMNRPTALIAEDEPLMRERLKEKLAEAWPELEIVAEAADGDEALALFDAHRAAARVPRHPDAGHAPGSTSRPRSAPNATSCSSPRTTSTRSQAFDAGAVDYLLKPVEAERLAATVERVRRKLAAPPADLSALIAELRATMRGDDAAAQMDQGGGRQAGASSSPSTTSSISSPTPSTRASCSRNREALIRTPLKDLLGEPRSRTASGRSIAARSSTSTPSPACCARTPSGSSSCSRNRPERLAVSRQFFHLFKQM